MVAIKTVLAFVGIIIFALVLLLMLQNAENLAELLNLKDVSEDIGSALRLPVTSHSYGEVGTMESITNNQLTPSEVACKIARTIWLDAYSYGYQDDHGGEELIPIDKKVQLLYPTESGEEALFVIEYNYARGRNYEYGDLDSESRSILAEYCSDEEREDGTRRFGWCQGGVLDEECISLQLSTMKINDRFICTGKEDKRVELGGLMSDFGNEKCKGHVPEFNPPGGLCDDKERGCPSGSSSKRDQIIGWRGAESSKPNVYLVHDNDVIAGGFPPWECSERKCNPMPMYMWLLYWDTDKKKYVVEVPRVPRVWNAPPGDTSFANNLGEIFKEGGTRNLKAGLKIPELRMKSNIVFTPSRDILLTDFLDTFIGNINDDTHGARWDYEIMRCTNEADCYNTVDNFNCKDNDCTSFREHEVDCDDKLNGRCTPLGNYFIESESSFDGNYCGDNYKKKWRSYRRVFVHTNIEQGISEEEYLEAGRTYSIIVNRWEYMVAGKAKDPGCSGFGKTCWRCRKTCTHAASHWARDVGKCNPWYVYEYKQIDKYYTDQSLIIFDMGKEPGPEGSALGGLE